LAAEGVENRTTEGEAGSELSQAGGRRKNAGDRSFSGGGKHHPRRDYILIDEKTGGAWRGPAGGVGRIHGKKH